MLLDLTSEETAPHCVTEGWIKFIGQPYAAAHTHHSAVAARIASSNCLVTRRIPSRRASGCCAFTTYDVATIPVEIIASVDTVNLKKER